MQQLRATPHSFSDEVTPAPFGMTRAISFPRHIVLEAHARRDGKGKWTWESETGLDAELIAEDAHQRAYAPQPLPPPGSFVNVVV